MNILEVASVRQVFRSGFWMKRVTILHDISLEVPRGSIFGFLGPNGAGKTTLIQLIVGCRKPVSGSVRVAGHDAASREARSRIGYLPERPYFHEHLTGEGLLKYFGALAGMPTSRVRGRIPEILEEVGLKDAQKLELRKYSKGMLQRIGIAQAILHEPELLVLDEPMSGLDPVGRKEMRELILKLARNGRTVFFSTHIIPDVEAICDQIGIIRNGRLVGSGPIGGFLAKGPVRTEIGFSGLSMEQAHALAHWDSLREIPGGIRGVLLAHESGQSALTAALQALLQLGAQLQWVTPIRPSLEELFE